ncbi:MAG: glycine cleavage system aminomethyltransferase GcvT [bacterium]|nr:glycine cleavage system aminomethyltransferase GcvT [bacterium]
MESTENLKRTPLYNDHLKLGAKIVPFAGWEMPVKYAGLIEEHMATRTKAGLFDVSHMGEITVQGPEAEKALSFLCCNDVTKLTDGKAQYSAITNPNGGLEDDIIIYRMAAEDYFVCVNASNIEKDFKWFLDHNEFNATFTNVSSNWGQIAIQGPQAIGIFEKYSTIKIRDTLSSFEHKKAKIHGAETIIARTGYTGEDGVEIFIQANKTSELWNGLLEAGQTNGILPCGLGARDTLRLEACLPLYGHELGADFSAIESGIGFFVKISERDFLGKKTIKEHKENGAPRGLVGFFVEEPGIVREGTKIFSESGREIGFVTSGTKTPCLEKPLGLAIVEKPQTAIGSEIFAEVRGKKIKCKVTKKPFYKRQS